MIKVYGIPNCDTVKKALTWLKQNNIQYEFHDYKKLGISEEKLGKWAKELGWETLLNKRGTTWKKLEPGVQASVNDEASAIAVMQHSTSVIKRPLIEGGKALLTGFDEEMYKKVLR